MSGAVDDLDEFSTPLGRLTRPTDQRFRPLADDEQARLDEMARACRQAEVDLRGIPWGWL